MAVFTGAACAVVTPFKADGSVDFDQFAKNIEFQVNGGTDAIIVCGSTGEASTLSHEEHLDVIEFCVKQVNKRIPVIAGTGSNSTETAIYLSKEAEKRGVDGVLVVSPYYNKATKKGLFEHFKMIADSIKIPVILYNIPGRTGVTIANDVIIKLCTEVENIVGVKESLSDISEVIRLSAMSNGKVDIYCGDDNQTIPYLSVGAKGVISVMSNIAPDVWHNMCKDYFDGNCAKATETQLKAIPLIDALFSEVNPIPVKAAMNMLDADNAAGPLRRPLTEMEDAHKAVLKEEMVKFGLKVK